MTTYNFDHNNVHLELVTRTNKKPHLVRLNDSILLSTMSFDEARQRFEKAINRHMIGGYASI